MPQPAPIELAPIDGLPSREDGSRTCAGSGSVGLLRNQPHAAPVGSVPVGSAPRPPQADAQRETKPGKRKASHALSRLGNKTIRGMQKLSQFCIPQHIRVRLGLRAPCE